MRYSLLEVYSNSFGDQIIKIYDSKEDRTETITNSEGSWENPKAAVEYLNRNSDERGSK